MKKIIAFLQKHDVLIGLMILLFFVILSIAIVTGAVWLFCTCFCIGFKLQFGFGIWCILVIVWIWKNK